MVVSEQVLSGLGRGLAEFIKVTQLCPPSLSWIYRGQADISWPLLPKAGRADHYIKATKVWVDRGQTSGDLARFNVWRRGAVAYCEHLPTNQFECLAYAQHYGLATRLLDWTSNPLVALFFAVEVKPEVDGVVFCHLPSCIVNADVLTPENCDVVACYRPRPFDRRILTQAAMFTYHPCPNRPLVAGRPCPEAQEVGIEVDLVRVRIPAKMKAGLQSQLANLGMTRATIFPDLEGLSALVNWETREIAETQANRVASQDP